MSKPICYSKMIKIGEISQYIDVRGKDERNPLLIILHGGPGSSVSHIASKLQVDLEEDFLVVNWDQRGAGRTYTEETPKESMNINQFVDETMELIDYLLNIHKQKKLYLAGHSWGSILGLITASKYPDKIHAYNGIGQVANMKQGEEVSYQFAYNEARARKNIQAIQDLEIIGEPPFKDPETGIEIKMKYIHQFGGSSRNFDVFAFLLNNIPKDLSEQYFKGLDFSSKYLFPQMMDINFFETIKVLDIPVYFIMGKYDYQTPTEIVKDYYDILEAPSKNLIIFEESAHCPNYEEPEKFAKVMKNIYKETYPIA